MANWCLPRNLSNAFLDAIKSGKLSPESLNGMTSEERRAAFSEVVGEGNARMVNAEFERTMLLADQKRGLVTWAKKIGGIGEPARRDMLSSIEKLDRVLNPDEEKAFLEDLAAKRLGVTVTSQEAKEVYALAQHATALRDQITAAGEGDYRAGWNRTTGTAYMRASMELSDKIESLKPGGSTLLHKVENVLALTRQLETGIMHFSAPGVQAYGMVSVKQFWTGIGQMFQFFANDEAYLNFTAYMRSHPDFEFAKGGGLGLTQVGDKLSAREEDIQSSLLEGANQYLSDRTGVKNLIKGWSQAFTGYLNYVRFERFLDILNSARMRGEDIRPDSEATHDIAQVVNNFTGRAELGYRDKVGHIAAPANMILYTVRKNVATFQMLNPYEYLKPKMSNTARIAAVRQLTGMVLFTGAVVGLAGAMGAKVATDPRSNDFLKINIGGEKLDLGGANASYIKFLAHLYTNQEITAQGRLQTYGAQGAPTRKDMVGNYLIGKLAPNSAFIADALLNQTYGQPSFNVGQELYDKMSPILLKNYADYWMNNPDDVAAIVPSLSSILGIGLESPLPPMSESGRDVWGDPIPPFGTPNRSWRNDPVNQEFADLGSSPPWPPQDRIRGRPLTADQYDDYVRLSGRMAHMRLTDVIQSQGWEAVPAARRLSIMKSVIRTSRDAAATSIMLQSQGGPNDIMRAAKDAKMAQFGAQPALEAAPQ